ncbi:MAG: hypothetical protein ABL993_09650 [Vicinamibacterales bacterium]
MSGQGLDIEPIAGDGNAPSLLLSWQPVELGVGGSYGCTITAPDDHALTVTIDQPPYHKALTGRGSVTIVAIPLGSVGASGRLIARDDATGASAEFAWRWQPRDTGRAANTVPATRWRKMSGLVKRLAGLVSDNTAPRATTDASASIEPLGRSPVSAFDGEWISAGSFKPYAIRITGSVGICTLSNAPEVYAAGDIALYIDALTETSLSGRHVYVDGKFRPVTGTLTQPGCFAMAHTGPDRFVVQSWELRRR